jgi:xylan 1,4-beta-xylosidase
LAAKVYPRPLPLFITEWGSNSIYSYSLNKLMGPPNDHDLPNDAAFMFKAATEFNGLTAANSHWCYSDVFEEWGLPGTHWPVKKAAYHGGFGLITIDGIHKPAYHAFAFLHQMGKNLVKTEVNAPNKEINAMATLDSDKLAIAAWYWVDTVNKKEKSGPAAQTTIQIKNLPQSLVGKTLHAYRIDQDHGNTFNAWLKMGKPGNLSADQISQLKKLSDDTLRDPGLDRRIDRSDLTIDFALPPAGVVFLIAE